MHVAYVHSLLQTQAFFTRGGIEVVHSFVPGDSLVQRARNVLVAKFMASDCTHFMFIDGDIQWDASSVARLLAATQIEDIEIAGGIYPKKMLPVEFPMNFVTGAHEKLNQHPLSGFIEIKDAPTGFLMMRRSAIERMMQAYPLRRCRFLQDATPGEQQYQYDLFSCFIDKDGRFLSEDFGFSRLWQRIGGQVWMDPEIKLIHHGQYAYSGKISDVLVPADGSSRPRSADEIEGWMTGAELEWLRITAERMSSVVEIGCWKGRSTFALLSGCRGPITAVDHWLGSEHERNSQHLEAVTGDVYSQFVRNVGHFKNLRIVRKASSQAASEVEAADMVFIDAGHTFAEVRDDIRAWRDKARRLICGHDGNYSEVQRAVREELGDFEFGAGSIWFKEIAA